MRKKEPGDLFQGLRGNIIKRAANNATQMLELSCRESKHNDS